MAWHFELKRIQQFAKGKFPLDKALTHWWSTKKYTAPSGHAIFQNISGHGIFAFEIITHVEPELCTSNYKYIVAFSIYHLHLVRLPSIGILQTESKTPSMRNVRDEDKITPAKTTDIAGQKAKQSTEAPGANFWIELPRVVVSKCFNMNCFWLARGVEPKKVNKLGKRASNQDRPTQPTETSSARQHPPIFARRIILTLVYNCQPFRWEESTPHLTFQPSTKADKSNLFWIVRQTRASENTENIRKLNTFPRLLDSPEFIGVVLTSYLIFEILLVLRYFHPEWPGLVCIILAAKTSDYDLSILILWDKSAWELQRSLMQDLKRERERERRKRMSVLANALRNHASWSRVFLQKRHQTQAAACPTSMSWENQVLKRS